MLQTLKGFQINSTHLSSYITVLDETNDHLSRLIPRLWMAQTHIVTYQHCMSLAP